MKPAFNSSSIPLALSLACIPGFSQFNDSNIHTEPRVLLPGNVHPAIRDRLPLGPADPTLPLERMILAFRMRPEARQRLGRLLADLQDPASPRYHAWLLPEDFAREFGPSREESGRVRTWLEGQGLRVDSVARGGMSLLFSGSASAVERAFATPLQRFSVDGKPHLANALEPSVPEGLGDLVGGVVSLHDFRRKAANTWAAGAAVPAWTSGSGNHYLAPGDFAAIYDLGPAHAKGNDGTGVPVAVIGRSDPGLADVAAFRAAYGLPQGHVSLVLNGPDPGSVSSLEDLEANLDMQWSGATAPGASILFVCSGSTNMSDGVDLSARYAVDQNLAPVMTLSFSACERDLGQAGQDFYGNLWAQAAAQGITVCVASGDSGAAGCDSGGASTGSGAYVSGLASPPDDVCVGGTMFTDSAGAYWAASNAPQGTSAQRYIPEAAWNESGSAPLGNGLWATGGGVSTVYPKPAWQGGPGVPADGRRDLPDVAFSAAGHDGYLIRSGGSTHVVGGTSAPTPAFAGIAALLVQGAGGRQGNLNPRLYALAALQAQGTGPTVFHDILSGDNTVPGVQGYAAGTGYDAATGLGSLDVSAFLGGNGGLSLAPGAVSAVLPLGGSYAQAITASGGTPPYRFSVDQGRLPPGWSLSPAGLLSGPASAPGMFAFTLSAVDAAGVQGFSPVFVQMGPVSVILATAEGGQLAGATVIYKAQVAGAVDTSATWTATGGVLTRTGAASVTFSAPPGTYTLTATSTADPGTRASLKVDVHGGDLQDVQAGLPLSGLDALVLAGAMGTRNPALDLDGDGVVGEGDLSALFAAMEW